MPLQLMMLCWLLSIPAMAQTAADLGPLFSKYEAYMYEGKGEPTEIFSARQLKQTPIPKGALKGQKKIPFQLQVRPSHRHKDRAYVKLRPKEEISFIVVKQADKWLIDGKSADDED